MEYISYTFSVPLLKADAVEGRLYDYGCRGIYVIEEGERVKFKAYFDSPPELPEEVESYVERVETLMEEDWGRRWRKYFKPTKVSEHFWVVPSWMKGRVSVKGTPIYIYPARTFGTGTHETTRLSILLIEKVLKKGSSLLDVGSGSGILSIAAEKMGAGRVVACDIQDEAEEELRVNMELNGTSNIEFVRGSAKDVAGKFDVVVANIEKHLLEPILKDIVERSERFVIVSGILKTQEMDFLERAERLKLKLIEKVEEGDWVSFLFEVKNVR